MSRDHRKLKVFDLAHQLVRDIYKLSFPSEEKFGLQSQIRRAAVSISTNIVEGCYRRTEKDYVHFLWISLASAAELRYLTELARELGYIDNLDPDRCDHIVRLLRALIVSLEPEVVSRKSEVNSSS